MFSQGARIGIYCFGLNSKIWKLVNARGVVKQSGRDGSVLLRISRSFEGHCALTNADEANEVQQNVVTAKKGKKRGIKAILRRSR